MAVHELFAYLRVANAAKAIDFYRTAFDATEKFRLAEPSGRIGHAELDFNGMTLMLSDEFPEYGMRGPSAQNSGAVTLHLHVDNADAVLQRAVEAGATLEMAAQDHFYGERSGSVIDPFGHRWSIGHTIEQLTPEEMQRRYTEMLQQ
jgi:PhnB protein